MDIESDDNASNEELDFEPLTLKTDKPLVLSREAEESASNIFSKRSKKPNLHRAFDPDNKAQRSQLNLSTKEFGNYEHFLTKNKHRSERVEVLEALR